MGLYGVCGGSWGYIGFVVVVMELVGGYGVIWGLWEILGLYRVCGSGYGVSGGIWGYMGLVGDPGGYVYVNRGIL